MSIPVLRRLGDHTAELELSDGRVLLYVNARCIAVKDPIRGVFLQDHSPRGWFFATCWSSEHGISPTKLRHATTQEFEELCDV